MLNYENERSLVMSCYVTNVEFLVFLVLLPVLCSIWSRSVIWLRVKYLGCHYLAWTIRMVTTTLRTHSQYNVSNILRLSISGQGTLLYPTQFDHSVQTLLVIRCAVNS